MTQADLGVESLQKVRCDGEGCRGAARPPPPAPHGPGFLSFTFPTITSPWQLGCREQQLSEGIRATASVERVRGPCSPGLCGNPTHTQVLEPPARSTLTTNSGT